MGGMEPARAVMKQHLDALCDELTAVIEDAAASGNEVVETWTGYGQAVRLRRSQPVLVPPSSEIFWGWAQTMTLDSRGSLQ